MFHRHCWEEVARRFVPPVSRPVKYGTATEALVYDLANGYTVVELRCKECGDVTSRHLQGNAT